MRRLAAAVLVLCPLCAVSSAQETCPWLTEGTASALLGGPVTTKAHGSGTEGSCTFSRTVAATSADSLTMDIAVSHRPPHECTQGAKAPGVGEDAALCAVNAVDNHREVLRGRVRSTWFLISLTARGAIKHDDNALRRLLEQVGEEVAGSLF